MIRKFWWKTRLFLELREKITHGSSSSCKLVHVSYGCNLWKRKMKKLRGKEDFSLAQFSSTHERRRNTMCCLIANREKLLNENENKYVHAPPYRKLHAVIQVFIRFSLFSMFLLKAFTIFRVDVISGKLNRERKRDDDDDDPLTLLKSCDAYFNLNP